MVSHATKTPTVPGFRMIAEMYPCIYHRLYFFSARIYGVYTRYMQTYMFLARIFILPAARMYQFSLALEFA